MALLMSSCLTVASAKTDTDVFIPSVISKLGLPDMPDYITLKTKTDRAVVKDADGNKVYQTETWEVETPWGTEEISFIKYDYNGNPIPVYGITNGADIELQFSEKPDWVGVIWAEGY
ncbi:MAG: hypothetical protein IJL71_06360, partial [Oscillospiraceae bacterium]|nr:hypothetical protein [Oscillospiraceae bacterium]